MTVPPGWMDQVPGNFPVEVGHRPGGIEQLSASDARRLGAQGLFAAFWGRLLADEASTQSPTPELSEGDSDG